MASKTPSSKMNDQKSIPSERLLAVVKQLPLVDTADGDESPEAISARAALNTELQDCMINFKPDSVNLPEVTRALNKEIDQWIRIADNVVTDTATRELDEGLTPKEGLQEHSEDDRQVPATSTRVADFPTNTMTDVEMSVRSEIIEEDLIDEFNTEIDPKDDVLGTTEGRNVNELATSALDALKDVAQMLSGFIDVSNNTILATLQRRVRRLPSLAKTAQSTLDKLSNISSCIQQLHAATDGAAGRLSFMEKVTNQLRRISKRSERLIIEFQGETSELVLRQLMITYSQEALSWMTDSTAFLEGPLSALQTQIPDNLPESNLCPLEIILSRSGMSLTRTGFAGRQACPVTAFTKWASGEGLLSDLHSKVGSLQSVYLYRQRKAPFYHEYALLGFGDREEPESWLRVERAARGKSHTFELRADSSAPLFQGVTLRETATFASARESLNHDSDELACVVFNGRTPESSLSSRILLHDVAAQISLTSNVYPRYRLWTANCRYFARRIVLNIAELVEAGSDEQYEIRWSGKARSIRDALRKERFGGEQLAGSRGAYIRTGNLIALGMTLATQDQAREGLTVCKQALSTLQEALAVSSDQLSYVAYAMHAIGSCHLMLDHLEEALSYFKNSYDLTRRLTPPNQLPNAVTLRGLMHITDVLYRLGRWEDAVDAGLRALEVARRRYDEIGGQVEVTALAVSLTTLARNYCNIPELRGDASPLIVESLLRAGSSYAARPDLGRANFSAALEAYAEIVTVQGRGEESVSPSQYSLALIRKELATHNPTMYNVDLADRLYRVAYYLLEADRKPEALLTIEEALNIRRHLYDNIIDRADSHRYRLASTLERYADVLHASGRTPEACEIMREAISLSGRSTIQDIGHGPLRLPHRLGKLSIFLRHMGRPFDALTPTEEALELLRSRIEGNIEDLEEELLPVLEIYAGLLKDLHKEAEAQAVVREIISICREISIARPDTFQPQLAERLVAFAVLLTDASQFSEACEVSRDGVTEYFHLYKRLPAHHLHALEEALDVHTLSFTKLLKTQTEDSSLPLLLSEVSYLRDMFNQRSHPFRTYLATILLRLALTLHRLSRYHEAFDPVSEALDHARIMHSSAPETNRSNLASALEGYSMVLLALRRRNDALSALRECVDSTRKLCELRPDDFTRALNERRRVLVQALIGDKPESLDARSGAQEAANITREMYAADPGSERETHVQTLLRYAMTQQQVGNRAEVCNIYFEIIDVVQKAFANEPEKCRPQLADRLGEYAVALDLAKRPWDALDALREALIQYLTLYTIEPNKHFDNLVVTMQGHLAILRDLSAAPSGLSALQTSVALIRKAYSQHPHLFRIHLGELLLLKIEYIHPSQTTEKLDLAREVIDLARPFYAPDPMQQDQVLAHGLELRSLQLFQLGRPRESHAGLLESISLTRPLFAKKQEAFREPLARRCHALGRLLFAVGQPQSSYDATYEALSLMWVVYMGSPSKENTFGLRHIVDLYAQVLHVLGRWTL